MEAVGLETWAFCAAVTAAFASAVGLWLFARSESGKGINRVFWDHRNWLSRSLIMFVSIIAGVFLLGVAGVAAVFTAVELRVLEPTKERLKEVTGLEVPEEPADYEAWHDEIWLDGSYYVTFSVPSDQVGDVVPEAIINRGKDLDSLQLDERLGEMSDAWEDEDVKRGWWWAPDRDLSTAFTSSDTVEVVVDLSKPDRAVIYAVGRTY